MATNTHEFIDGQTNSTHARAVGVPPAADYRRGLAEGEVAWWWVG